jgi:hypothetical protein
VNRGPHHVLSWLITLSTMDPVQLGMPPEVEEGGGGGRRKAVEVEVVVVGTVLLLLLLLVEVEEVGAAEGDLGGEGRVGGGCRCAKRPGANSLTRALASSFPPFSANAPTTSSITVQSP